MLGRQSLLIVATTMLVGVACSPNPTAEAPTIVGTARVIDADTIDIDGQRIRFHAIDAPENRQLCSDENGRDYKCGRRATAALANKIGQQTVSCSERDVDRFGRIVAVCNVGDTDLNGWLVSEGWAVAYRRYGWDYVGEERAAREAKRGIWAGTFMPPEEWRRQN